MSRGGGRRGLEQTRSGPWTCHAGQHWWWQVVLPCARLSVAAAGQCPAFSRNLRTPRLVIVMSLDRPRRRSWLSLPGGSRSARERGSRQPVSSATQDSSTSRWRLPPFSTPQGCFSPGMAWWRCCPGRIRTKGPSRATPRRCSHSDGEPGQVTPGGWPCYPHASPGSWAATRQVGWPTSEPLLRSGTRRWHRVWGWSSLQTAAR